MVDIFLSSYFINPSTKKCNDIVTSGGKKLKEVRMNVCLVLCIIFRARNFFKKCKPDSDCIVFDSLEKHKRAKQNDKQ